VGVVGSFVGDLMAAASLRSLSESMTAPAAHTGRHDARATISAISQARRRHHELPLPTTTHTRHLSKLFGRFFDVA